MQLPTLNVFAFTLNFIIAQVILFLALSKFIIFIILLLYLAIKLLISSLLLVSYSTLLLSLFLAISILPAYEVLLIIFVILFQISIVSPQPLTLIFQTLVISQLVLHQLSSLFVLTFMQLFMLFPKLFSLVLFRQVP